MRQTALITGASSGIGAAFAEVFARNGHNLVLTARSGGKLEDIATALRAKYKVDVAVLATDLSKTTAPAQLWQFCKDHNLRIDFLINNAGFADFGFFHESDWAKQEEMIDLNMKSLTHLSYLFSKEMAARKSGKIVNVASTAAFQPGPLMSIYYATKAYVLFFSEGLANELKDFGVTVTALCPGATESGFQAKAEMEDSKLVKGKKMPSSLEVAEYGYKAMMKGKVVAVHGFMNYLMSLAPRFFPRKMTASIVRNMQERSR